MTYFTLFFYKCFNYWYLLFVTLPKKISHSQFPIFEIGFHKRHKNFRFRHHELTR